MNQNLTHLPIDDFRQKIEKTIDKNPVTIITAETGAGKSTRLPLWLWKKGAKVHVTQPRRIAARSLSYYLSTNTSTRWGVEIGYQTGFDQKFNRQTSLLYLTDGVQMLHEIKGNRAYDYLIIDEIHEWNLNQEVLIGIIKKNLIDNNSRKNRPKIIIMSATLQSERLSAFLLDAPVISIPGRNFAISMHHNQPVFLLSDTIQLIDSGKNILVFQPGKKEIDEFILKINETLVSDHLKAVLLPLHSELSIKEQARVFKHYPYPKLVVATDIAQTSLTIDDIDAVVDTGIKKEIRYIKGIEGLYPVPTSRSECLQRAGRAGRVKSGQYILCADMGIEDRVPFPQPEIKRLNLDSIVLRLIKWGISPVDFPFYHSPPKNQINKALYTLRVFGAIDESERITSEGQKMAELPVSIRSARLLIEAQKGGPTVVDRAIKIMAILECKGIVNKDYQGEKFFSAPYLSDLFNQLYIWLNENKLRKIINGKKLGQAKEIHRELSQRIKLPKAPTGTAEKDNHLLFRSIISSFADHIYYRSGSYYLHQEEQRQLDKNSILNQSPPDMVVGLPFDLVINSENRQTGQVEKIHLPLITFCSELTMTILDALKPFSYKKEREISIVQDAIRVIDKVYFGFQLIGSFQVQPDWQNVKEKNNIIKMSLRWLEDKNSLIINDLKLKLRQYFEQIQSRLKIPLRSFENYWQEYLNQKIKTSLNTIQLIPFFNSRENFSPLTLKEILPPSIVDQLRRQPWPENIELYGQRIQVTYQKHQPFIEVAPETFEKMSEDDLFLPTGRKAGLILFNRKLNDWEHAVYIYNLNKSREVFSQKWQKEKQEARWQDLEEIPFPQPFIGGKGKNIDFEYYAVPEIIGDKVFLIHYFDKDKALVYFKSMEQEWLSFLQRCRRQQIADIFKNKGWKVKT